MMTVAVNSVARTGPDLASLLNYRDPERANWRHPGSFPDSAFKADEFHYSETAQLALNGRHLERFGRFAVKQW
jgi:hypothetical protein